MTEAYAKGYQDGSTRGRVYDPKWNYTPSQKQEYWNGFREGRND